jgi:glycosyltransferase involved in cell wall biosynthesis
MSSTHWHFLWQRPQQIMSRLSRDYNILFVDPPYPVADSEIPREKGGGLNISNRLNPVSDSLKILSPYQVAENKGDRKLSDEVRNNNKDLIKEQIQQVLLNLKWTNPALLWIYNPKAVSMVGSLGEVGVIYDCVDSFSSFSWAEPRTRQWEEELAQKADLIIASAGKLYNGWKDCGKPVYLIPNAADYEHFSKTGNYNSIEPPDLKSIKGPRLGFVGAIYEWLDFELIKLLAANSNPHWNIIMIGPKQHGLEIPECPNIYWLGPRDYKTLPWYLQNFDIMLIPFLRNEITEHANPIKLWECLAAGKPVVSTLLPEIPRITNVTWVSEDYLKFRENCINALYLVKNQMKRKEIVSRARLIAKINSWEERYKQIRDILKKRFG